MVIAAAAHTPVFGIDAQQVYPQLISDAAVTAGCFYRASICEGGLGSRNSVPLSVRLSVRLSHVWVVTKLNDALQIF